MAWKKRKLFGQVCKKDPKSCEKKIASVFLWLIIRQTKVFCHSKLKLWKYKIWCHWQGEALKFVLYDPSDHIKINLLVHLGFWMANLLYWVIHFFRVCSERIEKNGQSEMSILAGHWFARATCWAAAVGIVPCPFLIGMPGGWWAAAVGIGSVLLISVPGDCWSATVGMGPVQTDFLLYFKGGIDN